VTKLIKWLGDATLQKLLLAYFVISAIILVLGVLIFFPLLLLYSIFGAEFSNLGPIATFFYGVMFNLFVVTPFFAILFIVKIFRRLNR